MLADIPPIVFVLLVGGGQLLVITLALLFIAWYTQDGALPGNSDEESEDLEDPPEDPQ